MNIWAEPVTRMEFAWVLPGRFHMLDQREFSIENERPAREVALNGFWIGRYPVTQGQWNRVMGNNPSGFKAGDEYPVENVSWEDAQEFIGRLNADSAGAFRLPTEAEWEYAARSGGKRERYGGGDGVDKFAWYADNSDGHTHPVGRKAANGLGLHDMCGNVMEWCEDWYREDFYTSFPAENPLCADDRSGMRVVRGGSWNYCDGGVRCEVRGQSAPSQRFNDVAFRLVSFFRTRSRHEQEGEKGSHTSNSRRNNWRFDMKKLAPALGILLVALIIAAAWVMHRSSVAAGARLVAENCGDCHDLTEAKKNEKGPYLWGIVNRRAATIPGFEYSEAFRTFAAARRFAWSEANLDLFITDPDRLIPGTRMAEQDQDSKHAKAFAGMQVRENRDTLITYLRTLK